MIGLGLLTETTKVIFIGIMMTAAFVSMQLTANSNRRNTPK